jgi:hypothetical protein
MIETLRSRFALGRVIVVADRGMLSQKVLALLTGAAEAPFDYIVGCRLRQDATVGNSRCQCATFSREFSDKMRHLLRMPGPFSVPRSQVPRGAPGGSPGAREPAVPAPRPSGERPGASWSHDLEGGGYLSIPPDAVGSAVPGGSALGLPRSR